MCFNLDVGGCASDCRKQGNTDYYQSQELEKRQRIKEDPRLTDAVKMFWNVVPKNKNGTSVYVALTSAHPC